MSTPVRTLLLHPNWSSKAPYLHPPKNPLSPKWDGTSSHHIWGFLWPIVAKKKTFLNTNSNVKEFQFDTDLGKIATILVKLKGKSNDENKFIRILEQPYKMIKNVKIKSPP
jgi:hypothetical protein